ncbi:MAG: YicC family protein [Smithellaceae bacterium]|nr:YicC family protein [Syntrophaceae bacterium]MDD4239998.1 YicC family protein [Smithellaceae bacterium]NLX51661.1 YicC family protein [Deltaproteobacteria bacterium]
MIKSMTGYGRVEALCDGRNIVVEAKSVNHRFLEIALRLPAALYPLELEYKKKIGERFKRGRIDVSIRLEGEGAEASRVQLNMDIAREYFAVLTRLKDEFGISEPVRLKNLVSFRDIFTPPAESELGAEFLGVVEKTLHEALSMLANMRQGEGIALFSDMQMRLEAIRDTMEKIRMRAPQVVLEYQKRLAERIKELTGGLELDAARLAQEVAVMADRCDITEEIVRMQSHITQFEALLQSEEAEGRKIDFLLQEMNREINTIGSKGNDAEIARQVIEAKSELGKLREQAQNIE